MKSRTISVLSNFSKYPGLRHCKFSETSGERFYHEVLNSEFKKSYENNELLKVVLDQTDGYASSFLDESFGNLVYDFTLEIVRKHLEIISEEEPHWLDMIYNKTFVEWEERRRKSDSPRITAKHKPWFRIVGTELKIDTWIPFSAA